MNSEITAIIPIKIDSDDRLKNINTTISFLLKHHNCKIIVKEVDVLQKTNLPKHDRLFYIFEQSDDPFFHRTKILNEMLLQVDTKYTINYDCDMLISQKTMNMCLTMLKKGYDLVYPYQKNTIYYTSLLNDIQRQKFITDENTDHIDYLISKYMINLNHPGVNYYIGTGLEGVVCSGGMQFFNTQSYIEGCGENELFIDWGPEDYERLYRFFILGYKIGWIDSGNIYHIDHKKTKSTETSTKTYQSNLKNLIYILSNIKNKNDMTNYMLSLNYTNKFKK